MRKILLGTALVVSSLLGLTLSAIAQGGGATAFTATVAPTENGEAAFYKATMNGAEYTGYEGEKLTSLNPDTDYVFVMRANEGYSATTCEFTATAHGASRSMKQEIKAKKSAENKIEYYYVTFKFPAAMGTTALEGKAVFTQAEAGNLIKVTANGATVVITANGQPVTETTRVKKDTDLVITVTPPTGHEIESVTFNGTKLTAEADKSYKVKMSEGEATLVVNFKGGTTPSKPTYEAKIAPSEHGTVTIHKVKLNADKKVEGYENEAVTALQHGEQYIVVIKPEAGFVLATISAQLQAQGMKMPINSWKQKINAMRDKNGALLYYYVVFSFPQVMGTESIEINITFDEGKLIKVTDNGATVKIMQGSMEVTPTTKVGKGAELTITVTASSNKEIVSVEFAGSALTLDATTKVYRATMPATEAALIVTLKNTSVTDPILEAVSVYPNPFTTEIALNNLTNITKVSMVNAQGVTVRTLIPNGANELHLTVDNLPAGLYLVVLEHNGAKKTIRIVK